MKSRLTVYIREGCHLCEAFLDELLPLAQHLGLEYELIDVDSSLQLEAKYGQRVPLLVADEVVICEYFIDPAKLDEYVRRVKVG